MNSFTAVCDRRNCLLLLLNQTKMSQQEYFVMMRSTRISSVPFVLALLLTGALAQAATYTGTVTNKTNGKPSAGDSVVLVDVQAGMSEAATATTDARGHYSLQSPGMGSYLIRVN